MSLNTHGTFPFSDRSRGVAVDARVRALSFWHKHRAQLIPDRIGRPVGVEESPRVVAFRFRQALPTSVTQAPPDDPTAQGRFDRRA